jgi:hypothetical protein
VIASVLFNFGQVPAGIRPKEQFTVTLNEDKVSINVKSSKQLVMFYDRKDHSQLSNGVLNLATTYNIEMASLAEIVAPFTQPMSDIAISNNQLTFSVGAIDQPDTFMPRIRIRQNSHSLIDRDLQQQEYQLVQGASGRTLVIVPLANLGLALDKTKKADLKLTAKLVLSGRVLNPSILPKKKELVGRATVIPQ